MKMYLETDFEFLKIEKKKIGLFGMNIQIHTYVARFARNFVK